MKKLLQYIIVAALVLLVGYHSVYFKKLSDMPAGATGFDAVAYSENIWKEKLPAVMDSAVELSALIQAISLNKESALENHTNALSIGNYRYALIRTKAVVAAVNEEEVSIQIPVADSMINATIAMEYIYGNAIRDASGLVNINDFPNTDQLNSVSEALNEKVRTSVVPAFRSGVKNGDTVLAVAALELNKAHIKWTGLELLPVRLQIVN